MGIYRGAGGSGDAVNDASSEALITIQARDAALAAQAAAEAAQTAAELAETNAETAETNAETAETNAETAATNAAASASAASTSASNAASSASAASTSASNASTSATNAASSASAASTSASNASTSATNASNSASSASTSATNASNSASAASTSATNAANSATAAANSATAAAASATLAASYTPSQTGNAGKYLKTDGTNTSWDALDISTADISGTLPIANGGTGSTTASGARTNLGLGTISTQDANNIAVTGGSINGTTFGASTASSGAFTTLSASGAFSANGGATLGDASGDALTINSSAVSIPNGLNFDSNTFVIDATNNRVGVATANPTVALDVTGSIKSSSLTSGRVTYSTTSGQLTDSSALTFDGTNFATSNNMRVTGSTASYASGTGIEITYVSASTKGGIQVYDRTANAYRDVFIDGANALIQTGGTERMRITSTGNVGIGTASPAERLDIASGNFKTTGFYFAATGGRFRMYNSLNSNFSEIYNPETGSGASIAFRYGGGEAMRIDSSGNVGIGTSTPAYRLEANSGSTDATALFDSTSVNGSHIRIASSGTVKNYIGCAAGFVTSGSADDLGLRAVGKISFATNGAAADMTLDASGNLGIGTTSPATKLDVNDTTALSFIINSTNAAGTRMEFRRSGTIYTYFGDAGSIIGSGSTGGTALVTNGANPLLFGTNLTERMRITSAGNVGIGTSSPEVFANFNTLEVKGQTSTTGGVIQSSTSDDSVKVRLVSYSAGALLNVVTNHAMAFNTNNTERMRITSGGALLLGTTTATGAAMDIQGSAAGALTLLNIQNTSADGAAISRLAIGSQGGNWYIDNNRNGAPLCFNNGSERMRIDSSGFVAIGNTVAATIDGQNGSGNLVVGSGSGNEGITVYTATNGNGTLAFADGTSAGDTYRGYLQYEHANNALAFGTNATERMRITSGGQVGIGVTPAAWDSFTPLQISANGTIAANNFGGGNTQFFVANGIYYGGGGYKYLITGTAVGRYAINGEYHYWFGAGSGTAGNAITETQIMQVSANSTLTLQGGTSSSGTGIAFPATQFASSNANTLDDYEEGTWTASDQSGASLTLTQSGTATYTKIGRMIYFTLYVTYPSTANTNQAKIALPFVNGGLYQTVPCLYTNSGNLVFAEITVNQAYINLYDNDFAGNITATTNANMSGKYLIVSGCYSV